MRARVKISGGSYERLQVLCERRVAFSFKAGKWEVSRVGSCPVNHLSRNLLKRGERSAYRQATGEETSGCSRSEWLG